MSTISQQIRHSVHCEARAGHNQDELYSHKCGVFVQCRYYVSLSFAQERTPVALFIKSRAHAYFEVRDHLLDPLKERSHCVQVEGRHLAPAQKHGLNSAPIVPRPPLGPEEDN